ncbi:hypothetical protein J2Z83_003653 [Virgibacillus natechei]|uniref:HIRAN domain-containing protein n=1 Tax=Virgibacillus natechei TaxID=1216297 RepID=A0ABS4IKN6_9BACI|nr:HIRAN domain-containing protein [Virgibacillus natechei]MBP1971502.1 hypothetical protein [Virgibacillus natechei]UZD12551.1 HIRAN domain-containing protein [Virgibacillus natechei]
MSDVQTLLVVWQNESQRLFYHIGTLSYYNGYYEFVYTNQEQGYRKLKDALENGYMLHPAFPDKEKTYVSKKLFPTFDHRLPSADRLDFKAILLDLGLDENASKMDVLKQTRGRLANDSYSFEQPLRHTGDGKLHSNFFIHGMRYQNLPEDWSSLLTLNEKLKLKQEPLNEYDSNAVAVYKYNEEKIGYIPAFYSKAIFSLMEEGAVPIATVTYINEKSTPHWWLKVDFECEIPTLTGSASHELEPMMQM